LRKAGGTQRNRSGIGRLRRDLALIALGASSAVRADLPEFGPASLDPNLFLGNTFSWIDFDSVDTLVSWPNPDNPRETATGWTPYVGGRVVYDNNIFRLAAPGLVPVIPTVVTRDDVIETITAGVDTHWRGLELLARADENRYARNTYLDNTSGSVALSSHWRLGSRFWGQAGATYDRKLAEFGSYHELAQNYLLPKDIYNNYRFYAQGHMALGSGWRLNAEAAEVKVTHTDDPLDKYTAVTGTLGAEYNTPAGTSLAVKYQVTNGHYGYPGFVDNVTPFNRNFQERTGTAQLLIPLGSRVIASATGGYISHHYTVTTNYDFSGAIWYASLAFHSTERTQLLLSSSRNVYAYVDAASEYFVSEASRVIARWSPTAKLGVELQYSHEDQRFIGPNPLSAALPFPQHSLIRYEQIDLTWSIARSLQAVLYYRHAARDSNLSVFAYDDSLVSASLQARF
jgi:hypothetical protein